MGSRRVAFFSVPALLLNGAMVALVLYLLFPRQAIFENPDYVQNPDGLSIAYLKVLMRADPGNVPLRINLAQMLRNSGQLSSAAQVLAPGMDQEPVPLGLFESYLSLTVQRLHAQPEGPAKEAIRQELFAGVERLLHQPYGMDRIVRLQQPATRWLNDAQRLQVLTSLKARATEPRQQLQVARELARLQESQGQPHAAVATLRPFLDQVETQFRQAFVDNLIRLELASGNPTEALALFRQHRTRPPMTPDTLRLGVRLARLAGASRDEQLWLQQLADSEPANLPLQRELLSLQLGEGEIAAALVTVRRLQAQPGSLDFADRERIARVLEWNDRPQEAVVVWQALYRDSHSELAYERSLFLTQGLYQWQSLTDLLVTRLQRGQLDPAGFERLAEALIRQGQFDQARERLDQGLNRYRGSASLQQRKLTFLLDLRDFPAAIRLLENLLRPTDAQRYQLASLYWRTRQPEQALETLAFEPNEAALADQVYALRLDLATILGRTDQLQADYERLVAMDDSRHSHGTLERLRNLAVIFRDYPTALRLSQRLFASSGDANYLPDIAEYQLALDDWQGLKATLNQWDQDTSSARERHRYWSLRALLYQRTGDAQATDAAYRQAYQLAPGNEDIQISWAWFQLAQRERNGASLAVLLARLGESPSDAALPVLAYGHSALGNTRQLLYWFRRGMPSRPGDISWLIGHARLLDQTGAPGDASDLRQLIIDQFADQPATTSQRLTLFREEQRQRQAWEQLAQLSGEPDETLEAMAYFALEQGHAQVAQALARQLQGEGPVGQADASGDGLQEVAEPQPGGPGDARLQERQARLVRALYPVPETREQEILRLDQQLHRLQGDLTHEERQSLMRSTVLLHQKHNRSLQLGSQWQNLGGFTVRRTGITSQNSRDRYRWTLNADSLNADRRGRLQRRPETATELVAGLDRSGARFDWRLALGQRPREQTRDTSASAEGTWRAFDRVSLGAGAHYRERTPDNAEAWWITRRNRLSVSANYAPFTRLNLNARLDALAVSSLDDTTLGEGAGIDLGATYSVFRNDPAWTVSANYQRRRLSLSDPLPAATLDLLAQPLATGELITQSFERIGVSTRWFHGEPHALYRTTPSPRFSLGLGAGYVLSTNTPDLGLEAGLGWRLLGDDELALSGRLSTQGLDGEGRADFNLTYTLYFGR